MLTLRTIGINNNEIIYDSYKSNKNCPSPKISKKSFKTKGL